MDICNFFNFPKQNASSLTTAVWLNVNRPFQTSHTSNIKQRLVFPFWFTARAAAYDCRNQIPDRASYSVMFSLSPIFSCDLCTSLQLVWPFIYVLAVDMCFPLHLALLKWVCICTCVFCVVEIMLYECKHCSGSVIVLLTQTLQPFYGSQSINPL